MVTKERLDELYDEIVCKGYCSIEVPSRVFEIMNQNPGTSRTEAIRAVMIERLQDGYKKGYIKASLEELVAVCDDLRNPILSVRSPHGSRNMQRLWSRVKFDSGERCQEKASTIHIGVPTWVNSALAKRAGDIGVTTNELAKRILTEWVEKEKGGNTYV